jgi:hypothetical protein
MQSPLNLYSIDFFTVFLQPIDETGNFQYKLVAYLFQRRIVTIANLRLV